MESLYLQHHQGIFRYVFNRTKNKELAEDITQSTFLKLLVAKTKEEMNKTYVYTTARNLLIDYYRKKQHVYSDDEIYMLQDTVLTENPYKEKEIEEWVRGLIDSLTNETQKKVITMKYLEGRDSQDIASKMDSNSDAVRAHLVRGMKIMRNMVKSI